MSKPREAEHKFPPLQKFIILHLKRSEPETKNQIKKGIKKDYKSTWNALDSLKEKGLAGEMGKKDYLARKYPLYWLTERGVFLAIYFEPNPGTLLKTAIELYPENEDLHFLIEMAPILGENALDVLYLAALTKGEVLDQNQVNSILARQMQEKLTDEQIKLSIAVLKKYPKQRQQVGNYLNHALKTYSELSAQL